MKICNNCKIEKGLNEFWKASRTKDGLATICIECGKERTKKWREDNRVSLKVSWKKSRENKKKPDDQRIRRKSGISQEECNRQNREFYHSNKDKIAKRRIEIGKTTEQKIKSSEYVLKSRKVHNKKYVAYQNQYHKLNRHKYGAHGKVRYALKSGRLIKPKNCEKCGAEKKLQGHHADYSKPLEVRWLCKVCHCHEHKQLLYISP